MKWLRKLLGMRPKPPHDAVPLELKEHWPAYYSFFRGKIDGFKVLPFSCFAKTGDVVGVLQDQKYVHCYEIKSIGRAPGSDHIVDPTEYDLVYHHSVERGNT